MKSTKLVIKGNGCRKIADSFLHQSLKQGESELYKPKFKKIKTRSGTIIFKEKYYARQEANLLSVIIFTQKNPTTVVVDVVSGGGIQGRIRSMWSDRLDINSILNTITEISKANKWQCRAQAIKE